MRWPRLALALMLLTLTVGCDRLGGGGDEAATEGQVTEQEPGAPVAAPPAEAEPMQQPAPPPVSPPRSVAVAYDEPWTPEFTGAVNPGMSYDEVVSVWGEPVAERSADGRQYLYFRNGCEVSCGTFDVVFLEGGQVVDAIVRGQGHTYGGTSSSPPGSEAMATLPAGAGS